MTRTRHTLLAAGVALALALGACGTDDETDRLDDVTTQGADAGAAEDLDLPDDLALCADTFGYADPTADLEAIDHLPAGWPDAPDGAVLCTTAGGGSVDTASYAIDADIAAVFAHYTDAVPGLTLMSGEETGTGYETLVGELDGIGVEVRERDAGTFVIAFAGSGL